MNMKECIYRYIFINNISLNYRCSKVKSVIKILSLVCPVKYIRSRFLGSGHADSGSEWVSEGKNLLEGALQTHRQ